MRCLFSSDQTSIKMGVKIFDLQLLVGRENIMGDKPRVCIESIETCGKNLYIGTNDCFIHHYVLQFPNSENSDRQTASVRQQSHKHIGMKKPVIQIKAASALNHLLINCDSTLVLLSMLDLNISTAVSGKIKNVNKFCVNQRPQNRNPFSVEICVSFLKRKVLQIYQVHKDHVVPMQELSLSETPRNLSVDGWHACIGTNSSYMMVNFETGIKQELFPMAEDLKNLRMVSRVGPSEFLITATNGLGVFVSTDGTSNRPPLQWSEGVFAAELAHPFIIALDDEFLTVHSLLDQQQKQSVSFQGGSFVAQCSGGMVLVCTPKDVFLLMPVPLQTQLSAMINDGQVDEALALLEASKRKLTAEKFTFMMNRVYCMSGFVRFQENNFDDAMSLFGEGCMDPRELISLFPTILPESSNFKRAVPPMHDIADIRQMCSNDKAQILECQEFLAVYLEVICDELCSYAMSKSNAPKYINGMESFALDNLVSDVIYSTIVLFAQLKKAEELQLFVEQNSGNDTKKPLLDMIHPEDCVKLIKTLNDCGCYHVCALIYLKCGDVDNAMKLWHSISSNELTDPAFPGLLYVAEHLAEFCQNQELLWQNAEWILQQDQSIGVQIFTSEKQYFKDNMQPDDVVNFLHEYPDAVLEYLHHLVMVEKIEKEKFHTHLAVLSLDKVLSLKSSKLNTDSEVVLARKKLQDVLNHSDLFRIHLLLGKIKDTNLYQEQVILHGKLGQHDKALEILVQKEKNPSAAKDYCLCHSQEDAVFQKELFHILLSVYFQDISATKGVTSSTAAVIDLLNTQSEDFESERVLHLLPANWSVSVLTKFLNNCIRHPLHTCRNKHIEYMLQKAQILQLQRELSEIRSSPVTIHDGKICQVCNKLISEGAFTRYPNGIVVHTHCGKDKHICPVTGKVFKMKKSQSNPDF
ncbi:unnamed protein product [Clavelina lepadiformis]|uniref:CNH domain-containing protein n=1 Tax=Clavelina lepadiformis TaxID=159417 RepID=A0ABP0GT06_CLALP